MRYGNIIKQGAQWTASAALLGLAGCGTPSQVVGTDCEGTECSSIAKTGRIDAVDVLFVVDNSYSITNKLEKLRRELPRMMNAIVTGNDEDTSFPPASSVHVAVVTSDLGLLGVESDTLQGCEGGGDDGVFLKPGEVGVMCDDVTYPGFLEFDRGAAVIATVDSVSCLPLLGMDGCGIEQPLEAGLKSVWPAQDPGVMFAEGEGHGEGENAGFLREDSLLVVIVVTDEDDCSAAEPSFFEVLGSDGTTPVNLACAFEPDAMHNVDRYVQGLKSARPGNDNVVFAVIAGVPPETLEEAAEDRTDWNSAEQAEAYFKRILNDPKMQPVSDRDENDPTASLLPSCTSKGDDPNSTDAPSLAFPPVRLVQTAAAFGTEGAVGSICAEDFGGTTGRIIRAVGERLTQAANAADE